MVGIALVTAGAVAHGQPAPSLATVDDVLNMCASVIEGTIGRDDALTRVYSVTLPAAGFAVAAYDARRARILVDAGRGFRGDGGRFELVLHDLTGTSAGRETFELAIPAAADEAAALQAAHARGELGLQLAFQLAAPADGQVCAAVHRAAGDGVRVAIEPLAFAVTRRGERVASGESPRMTAMRESASPPVVVAPRVVVAAPMLTAAGGRASTRVAKTASGLAPRLLECYRLGLALEPTLRGPLVAGVDLGPDGRVTAARAEIDGLGAPEVTSCVLRVVRAARFPGTRERLSIPMRFTD
jgi:hypothetical protein